MDISRCSNMDSGMARNRSVPNLAETLQILERQEEDERERRQRRQDSLSAGSTTATYEPAHSEITGFLIDLDGTVYSPGGLLPGARNFIRWLQETDKQFVLLSNTGAKCSEAVLAKLAAPPYSLQEAPFGAAPLTADYVFTAAEAQVRFLLENVPEHAKLFVLSGGGDFWLERLRRSPYRDKVDTWEIRTELSEAEAKDWATFSVAHQHPSLVWIVFFHDGPLQSVADPTTGRPGCCDWSFELLQMLSYLVSHRAELVYTAEDAFNPCADEDLDGYVWPKPGPGMFAEMLKKIMYPYSKDRLHCLGKGGNKGSIYMMEHAIDLLKKQGHSGERDKILMLGDRYDTDVRGGLSVSIKTCLIETGCHLRRMQPFFPCDRAHFVVESLAGMCPRDVSTASPIIQRRHLTGEKLLRIWMLSQGSVHSNTGVRGLSLGEALRQHFDHERSLGCDADALSSDAQGAGWRAGISVAQAVNALAQLEVELDQHEVVARLRSLGHVGEVLTMRAFSDLVRDALSDLGMRPQSPELVDACLPSRSPSSRSTSPTCSSAAMATTIASPAGTRLLRAPSAASNDAPATPPPNCYFLPVNAGINAGIDELDELHEIGPADEIGAAAGRSGAGSRSSPGRPVGPLARTLSSGSLQLKQLTEGELPKKLLELQPRRTSTQPRLLHTLEPTAELLERQCWTTEERQCELLSEPPPSEPLKRSSRSLRWRRARNRAQPPLGP